MKIIMKQNKNSSAIRFFSFVLALFVLFISISVPVFAYTDSSSNGIDFSSQPIPVLPTNSSVSSQFIDGIYISNSSGETRHACVLSSDENLVVYSFIFNFSNTFGGICFASTSNTTSFTPSVTFMSGSSYYSMVSSGQWVSSFDSTTGLYYSYYPGSGGSRLNFVREIDFPIFTDIPTGLTAVRDWIDNPPVVVSPHSLNTTLPAGNAIIIDVTGNNAQTLSLSSTSALRHKDNWSDGNQMMGYFVSAPTSLSSPFDGTYSITWRGVGSPNLFGGYNTWNTTAPLLPTGNYLVIVNPAYPNDNPDSITSNQASNGAITIFCGYCLSAQIVPLSSSWSNGSIVSSSGNLRLDGEYDPNTDSWTFNNSATGQPQNPVSGGLTDVDAEHITINDWLQNISHQIGSFFAGAIGAVSTLVSAGSDFIHSLSGLYAWLPAPVYSVLVSALILVITIGVIKVFI